MNGGMRVVIRAESALIRVGILELGNSSGMPGWIGFLPLGFLKHLLTIIPTLFE